MTTNEKIVPVILAAGCSERLGMPKALAQFGVQTAIEIAVENCAGYEQPVVVLGCDAERLRPYVPPSAEVLFNSNWRNGQLNSLLCALDVAPASAAVLMYPVDHPLLLKENVVDLVAEYRGRAPAEEIVMPRFGGRHGHPIIFSPSLREELHAAVTARDVVYRIPSRLRVFEAKSSAIYEDFHTPETLHECVRKFLARERTGD